MDKMKDNLALIDRVICFDQNAGAPVRAKEEYERLRGFLAQEGNLSLPRGAFFRGNDAGNRSLPEIEDLVGSFFARLRTSEKQIRTDFMVKDVTDAQQRVMTASLLNFLGFENENGCFVKSERPFVVKISENDIRIGVDFLKDFFIHSYLHILFGYGCAVCKDETKGKAISILYRNFIGRSEDFLTAVYSRFCEAYPQAFDDVIELELFEGANYIPPVLIPESEDELSEFLYTFDGKDSLAAATLYRKLSETYDLSELIRNREFPEVNAFLLSELPKTEGKLEDLEWYLEEKLGTLYRIRGQQSLKEKLEDYKLRTLKIKLLSTPALRSFTSADQYSKKLRDNFRYIGELAEQNRSLIKNEISPFVDSADLLDKKTAENITDFNLLMADANSGEGIDVPFATLLTERLSRDAKQKESIAYHLRQLEQQYTNYYMIYLIAFRDKNSTYLADYYRQLAQQSVYEVLEWLAPERFLTLDPESRKEVMIMSRYGFTIYESNETVGEEEIEKVFLYLEKSLQYAEDPFYREALPDYDWDYHCFRTYDYMALVAADRLPWQLKERLAGYMKDWVTLFDEKQKTFEQNAPAVYVHTSSAIARYQAGDLTKEEIKDRILEGYRQRNHTDYSEEGIETNIRYPMFYIRLLDPDFITEEEESTAIELYQEVLNFAFQVPKAGIITRVLDFYSEVIGNYREFPGGMTFEKMCLRSLAALHPPTYIHSMMVADLTRIMTEHAYRKWPELFSDLPDLNGLEEITNFAYHAARLHDIGKIYVMDIINVYGRNLFDLEFDILKSHPATGAFDLEKHRNTAGYADIARGHHKWYDDTKGYPADFRSSSSPYKVLIDITACADCMDAATDTVGRSYSSGKTYEDFRKEIVEGAGTRYAPFLKELLFLPEVEKDLGYQLQEGRRRLYRDTYYLLMNVNQI